MLQLQSPLYSCEPAYRVWCVMRMARAVSRLCTSQPSTEGKNADRCEGRGSDKGRDSESRVASMSCLKSLSLSVRGETDNVSLRTRVQCQSLMNEPVASLTSLKDWVLLI